MRLAPAEQRGQRVVAQLNAVRSEFTPTATVILGRYISIQTPSPADECGQQPDLRLLAVAQKIPKQVGACFAVPGHFWFFAVNANLHFQLELARRRGARQPP